MKKSLRDILNCCNLKIVLKYKSRLGNNFDFKVWISKDLPSDFLYKFQCGLCCESCYDECVRYLNVRIDEQVGTSPLA